MQNSESVKCSVCSRMQMAITDPESGEMICSNCGMVITEKFEDLGRTGAPTLLSRHDKGLATVIGTPTRDATGKELDSNTRSVFKRLKTWDSRLQMDSSTDKNLSKAFAELDTLKDKLGLSDTIAERTAYIYRKVESRGLTRGRTILGMLAASVYLACRETGTPRTLRDISRSSNIKRKNLTKSYRILTVELGIRAPVFDPMKCIVKVANTAKIGEKTKRHAFMMMNELLRRKTPSAGKNQMGLAASLLYVSCKETGEIKTQKHMANAAGVTEVTIRNRVRDLEKNLNSRLGG